MSSKVDKSDFEYNSQLDAFELYHLVIEDSKRPSHRNGGPVLPALGHALAGSVATATSKLLIYPLDLVIARLQVQKQLRSRGGSNAADVEYKGLVDAAQKIYRHEGGLSAFYTGCLTDVTKGIADSFLFFLAYSFLQQRELRKLPPNSKQRLSVAKEMGIGIASGAFSKLITTPLQNIITRQQTAALATAQSSDDGLKKVDKLTIADIARQIHKENGLAGFWTGYSLSLILTLNPAITFTVDNFLQKVFRARDAGSHVTFLVAAVSKAIASTITYPVSVAKSRAQAKPSDQTSDVKDAKKSASRHQQSPVLSRLLQLFAAQYAVVLSLRNIYRQDGLSGLYSGIEAEVLKGFLSHGLTMMIKEPIHGGIIELYYLLLKLTRNWPAEIAAKQEAASEFVADAKERIENAGSAALEAGKDAITGASERVENIGATAAEAGKSAATGVSQRTEDIATDASKRADNLGSTALEAGKNVTGEAARRADNVRVTIAERSKNIANGISQRVENAGATAGEAARNATDGVATRSQSFASDSVNAVKDTASDLRQRADNVGVTTFEAGKSVAAAAKGQIGDVSGNAIGAGKSIASEVKERASNVGVTVVEAGKHVLREIKK